MNAVGIDVSKGKSMVAVMRPFGEVVTKPFEVRRIASELRKAEAVKISNYALDRWVSLKNCLIAIRDQTFPGVNAMFSSPIRADSSEK